MSSTLIDFDILNNMADLRDIGGQPLQGFKVVHTDLINADEHDDLYASVISTPEDTFVKVYFLWNHLFGDAMVIYGDDTDSISPSIVTPKEVTTVVYV
jgi:hypothetical protein